MRLAVALLAVSASAIFARYALHGAGPLAVSALRLTIASLPLLVIAFVRYPGRLPLRTEAGLALAGLALAVHFATWIASLLYTSVALATLLVCTTPLWTIAFDAFVLRKAIERRAWLALALAAFGLAVVVMSRNAPAPVRGHALLGVLLALSGALAIGAYMLIVRALATHPAKGVRLATTQTVARTFGWAAIVLLLAMAFARQPAPGNDPLAWGGIVAMALVSQLLGHTLLNAALRRFSPTQLSTTILLEPVIAGLLAAVAFHEHVGVAALAGGACILVALFLMIRMKDQGTELPQTAELLA
ncbi:MAG: DMT family transporter [Candidatus Baltobacteraceae bacterium]